MTDRGRSFLAPPGEVDDWRRVVLLDAAYASGVPGHLPGTPAAVAAAAELDPASTRVLLEALDVFGDTRRRSDGSYIWVGPDHRTGEAAVTRHHARSLRRWAATFEDRLRGRPAAEAPPQDLEVFLPALATVAREGSGPLIDRCLAEFPQARRVLDLGGGHGELSLELARRGLDVTLQDLPAVIDYLREEGRLQPAGVRLFSGDFHRHLPDGQFDLVLMTGVAHIFAGRALQRLFSRLRLQLASGGGLAISTMLRGRDPVAPLFAVQMRLNGRGGDTHSEDEYRQWLIAAGYTQIDVVEVPDWAATLVVAR